jgi:5'(3')-deoxyribonucleotidase
MKPRVLVDVDGVLADFLTPALKIIERLTGRAYRPEEILRWDLFETIGKEWEQPFLALCNEPGFAASCPVLPGAQEGLRALQEVATVYIVTSPLNHNPTWTHERELWLHDHFGIHHKQIVHTSAKYLCLGDVIIDDRPKNITDWEAEHPDGLGLLWDAPWNRLDDVRFRARSWEEVVTRIAGTTFPPRFRYANPSTGDFNP